jgi:hypothetical protein
LPPCAPTSKDGALQHPRLDLRLRDDLRVYLAISDVSFPGTRVTASAEAAGLRRIRYLTPPYNQISAGPGC